MTRLLLTAAFGLLLPVQGAFAQPKKKEIVPGALTAPKVKQPRRRVEKAAPKLGAEKFVRKSVKQMAEEKWQEAFKILKKLIESTPNSDPAKPELYFRLSEMYWERASATDIRAFDDEEKCLAAANSKGMEKRCVAQREKILQGSQRCRDQAIKIYVHIVKNFPRYPRLDGVLFALAFNYQQKEQPEKAKKIYIELIKRYPRSRHVPDTLLNVGEIFFDAGKVDQALKAYNKVATNYRDSQVYGYALYKLGWCYFNVGDHARALRQFVKVIEHTNRIKRSGSTRNRLTLKKEAERDLVRAYVHIPSASPKKAIAFFRKVAPDNFLDLAEKLATLYGDTGQFGKSNRLFRQLIKLAGKTYKVVSYQRQISYNTANIGKQVEAVKELKRLVNLWSAVRDAKDADPKRVAKDQKGIEEQLRAMAVTYHRQSLKTKSDEDYAIAYDLYRDYVKVFPKGPNAYDMTFFYAELLYKLKKWKEAATMYEQTLDLKSDGQYTEDAAHGAVLSFKKLLRVKQDGGSGDVDKLDGDAAAKGIPKAKPLSEDAKSFIKAADRYKKYVKASEYKIDIQYDAARIYYDHNQFDKSSPRFKDIAENHMQHRLAVYAANLLLDTYNLTGEIKLLIKQVDIFLRVYTPQRDAEFYALLVKLKKQSSFKECQALERKEQWLKSARCYTRFARKYADKEFADKAWYNAGLNYERLKKLEKSIECRSQIVNNYSESDLAPKALYQIAGNLHAIAVYTAAAQAYEYYYKNFSSQEEAKEAARLSAQFRQGLEEYDKAIENYLAFMKMVGRKDKAAAAAVYFSLGTVYETLAKKCEKGCSRSWDRVIKHYNKFLKSYKGVAKADLIIAAHVQIGDAYTKKGKRGEGKKALKAYRTAFATFEKLSEADKKGLTPQGVTAAAEARYQMAEDIYRQFKRAPMKIHPYKRVKKYVKKMKEKIIKRSQLVADARTIYLEVIGLRAPNTAIKALARIGQMFQSLAEDIYNLPAPGSFDEEQVEVFKGAMQQQAEIPEGKAVSSYILCMQKSQELRWVNELTDECAKQLAKLKPGEYRYNDEILIAPTGQGVDFIPAPFKTKLETEE